MALSDPLGELRALAQRALRRVHACGVMHGDLRLANFVWSASGGIKLLDFGRAVVHASSDLLAEEEAELEAVFGKAKEEAEHHS